MKNPFEESPIKQPPKIETPPETPPDNEETIEQPKEEGVFQAEQEENNDALETATEEQLEKKEREEATLDDLNLLYEERIKEQIKELEQLVKTDPQQVEDFLREEMLGLAATEEFLSEIEGQEEIKRQEEEISILKKFFEKAQEVGALNKIIEKIQREEGLLNIPLEEMSEEERKRLDEQMEIGESVLKLEKTLQQWIEEMTPELQIRAKSFGLEESELEEVIKGFKLSFGIEKILDLSKKIEELKTPCNKFIINLFEYLSNEEKKMKLLNKFPDDEKKEMTEIFDLLSNEETKIEVQNLLNQLSRKDFLDLLDRKLHGDITLEEKALLYVLGDIENKGKKGIHSPLERSSTGEKIKIPLLNLDTFEEYKRTFMHEFTHLALDELIPFQKKERMLKWGVASVETREKETLSEEERAYGDFYKFLIGIDESLAYRATDYYIEDKQEPLYEEYKNKIHPKVFELIYKKIDGATNKMSAIEFDRFAAHIYSFFTERWRKDLSPDDVFEIEKATAKEIDRFKKR